MNALSYWRFPKGLAYGTVLHIIMTRDPQFQRIGGVECLTHLRKNVGRAAAPSFT